MNLYEALKAGTSEEELLKAFHKDLNEANARIKAEQQKIANQKKYDDCREHLAKALVEYAETCFDKKSDESFSVDSVVKILKEFEKEMKQAIDFSNKLDKIFEKTKNDNPYVKITTHTIDDDIINEFLKSLK